MSERISIIGLPENINSVEKMREDRLRELNSIDKTLDQFSIYSKLKDDLDAGKITQAQFGDFLEERKILYVTSLKLRSLALDKIASQLEALNPQLLDGIQKLEAEISALNDIVGILSAIGKVINIISRIVALA
jgi:hypothetical protein